MAYVISQVSHKTTACVCVLGCNNGKSSKGFGILIFHGVFTSYWYGWKGFIIIAALATTAAAVTVGAVVAVTATTAASAAALTEYVRRRDVNRLQVGA